MLDDAHITRALLDAFTRLRDPHSEFGIRLRQQLAASTGLSLAMIEWGLDTSLPSNVDVMRDALRQAPAERSPVHCAVVLSGNVFTACIRALGWPLLLGANVSVKASSHDDVLPRALLHALTEADAAVARRLQVATFDRSDRASLGSLLTGADVVSVYGSDATIDAIAEACSADQRLVAHGHGLGAAYVPKISLHTDAMKTWTQRIARDVAAYDQRGCLSPQVVWIETANANVVGEFAEHLARALAEIEQQLPRGPLPEAVAIAQQQWRGTRASCGELLEGAHYAVAFQDDALDAFTGPGYRNISVRACADDEALWSHLLPLGEHLKVLGVALDMDQRIDLAARVPRGLRPHVVTAGEMQMPPFDAPQDAEAPWFGLR